MRPDWLDTKRPKLLVIFRLRRILLDKGKCFSLMVHKNDVEGRCRFSINFKVLLAKNQGLRKALLDLSDMMVAHKTSVKQFFFYVSSSE